MILEAVILLVLLVVLAFMVEGSLILLYGAFRPTRIFGRITPCFFAIAIAFYILGKYGATNFWATLSVFGLILSIVVANFIWVAFRVTRPLNDFMNRIRKESNRVASVANKIASVSKILADGASRQAAGVEETTSFIAQMTATTKHNAESAGHVREIMTQVGTILNNVRDQMVGMDQSIKDITNSSSETDKIIKTIDGIAFQTNLLALNAAVEAARAGEIGAGFAVVADEVRSLALRASEAARESGAMLENTVRSVRAGSDLNAAAQIAFKDNFEMTRKVETLIDEVANASQEQAEGIGQISSAIGEIDVVTERNSAEADALASSAREMHGHTIQMKDFVGDLIKLFGIRHRATPKEAKKMAKNAVACIKAKGRAAFAEISDAEGRFIDRDLFVAVYDHRGTTLAHGLNRDLSIVGKVWDLKDARGKSLVLGMLDYMKGRKDGWYDHEFINPVTGGTEKKTAYAVKTGEYCVVVAADREQ